jgi:hypothetical protein
LLGELDRIINGARYPLSFSPRIRMRRDIRAKIKPYLVVERSPPPKQYEPPLKGR